MTGFMVRGDFFFLLVQDVFTQRTEQDLIAGMLKILHLDGVLRLTSSQERRLVDEVPQVGARKANCAGTKRFQFHVVGQGDLAAMDLQDGNTPLFGGTVDCDVSVEAARSQQGRVQHIRPVRRRQHNHGFRLQEAIHFTEDLIERLLALVVPSAKPAPRSRPTASISSMKRMHRSAVLGRTEKVPNPRRADADEHLNEFRPVNREERHAGLTGDGPRKKRFPVPGGPIKRTPLGICAPSRSNLPGLLRNSTISCNSSFACSRAATSWKVVRWSEGWNRLAWLRMKFPIIPPPRGSTFRRIM